MLPTGTGSSSLLVGAAASEELSSRLADLNFQLRSLKCLNPWSLNPSTEDLKNFTGNFLELRTESCTQKLNSSREV